jgi:protein SCO1/2
MSRVFLLCLFSEIINRFLELMNNKLKYILPLALVIVLISIYYFKSGNKKPITILPVYGPKNLKSSDTIFHTIKQFCFINQYGDSISQEQIKNKIFVCDYFFTTCKSICPIMTNQMERVQNKYLSNNDVIILSHTVDPEEDSVSVLFDYANRHHAIKGKWHFLTGDKKSLYNQARVSYLLDNETGNGDEHDFIHTDKFALIDWKGRIRGYYVGTDSAEVSKLITDISTLLDEKKWEENN